MSDDRIRITSLHAEDTAQPAYNGWTLATVTATLSRQPSSSPSGIVIRSADRLRAEGFTQAAITVLPPSANGQPEARVTGFPNHELERLKIILEDVLNP